LELKRLVLVACTLAVASGPALAAVKPDARATTSGNGTATVTGGPREGWRIVVATKPSGLTVQLKIRGEKKLIAKSPLMRSADCGRRCMISATARLWRPSDTSPTGTITLALHRE
jgi:hypothetical protein